MLTGSMCRLYVCLTATLTIKLHACIAIPAMSQTSDRAYPVCPDCSTTGSSSELCHTTQLDLLLCTTCGRTYTVDNIDCQREVSADE
jgi:elongation factor P hydroxylase